MHYVHIQKNSKLTSKLFVYFGGQCQRITYSRSYVHILSIKSFFAVVFEESNPIQNVY